MQKLLWWGKKGVSLVTILSIVATLSMPFVLYPTPVHAAEVQEVNNQICTPSSQVLISDATTTFEGGSAVVVSSPSPSWTASIPGASWIWSEDPFATISESVTHTFSKSFTITGIPLDSTIDIASDDDYAVSITNINGNQQGFSCSGDSSALHFQTAETCTIPASMLVAGNNTIEFAITNSFFKNHQDELNPGGLFYKVTINSETCIDAPMLMLVKQVVNNNGGTAVAGDWTLTATGPSVISGAGTVSSTDASLPGTYTLSEASTVLNSEVTEGYSASAWSCTNGIVVNDNNQITIAADQTTVCTIINDDKPATLTIIKDTHDEGDGTFNFTITGQPNVSLTTVEGSKTSDPISLSAGEYDVNENVTEGWQLADVTCVYDNQSVGQSIAGGEHITLGNGDDVTCTFTNTKKAVLHVNKTVINDNGGTKTAKDFMFIVNGGEAMSFEADGKNNVIVGAGSYTITEPSTPGYLSTLGEGCANIEVSNLGEATCSITNNDIQPKLTVVKTVINDNGGTKIVSDFPLFVGETSVTSGVENGFNAGTYIVKETQSSGYTGTISGACSDNGTIVLALGDTKTCTITNNDIAQTTSGGGGGGGGGGGSGGWGTVRYTITSSANGNGSVDPVGSTEVFPMTTLSYTMTPGPGSQILDVTVDGASVGPVPVYTFSNIFNNHTLVATFSGAVAGATTTDNSGDNGNGGGTENPAPYIPPTGGQGGGQVAGGYQGGITNNGGGTEKPPVGNGDATTGDQDILSGIDTNQAAGLVGAPGSQGFLLWFFSYWYWWLLLLLLLAIVYYLYRQWQKNQNNPK